MQVNKQTNKRAFINFRSLPFIWTRIYSRSALSLEPTLCRCVHQPAVFGALTQCAIRIEQPQVTYLPQRMKLLAGSLISVPDANPLSEPVVAKQWEPPSDPTHF